MKIKFNKFAILFQFAILISQFAILPGCSSPYLPIYSTSAPSFQLPISSISSLARMGNYITTSSGTYIHNGFDFNTTQNMTVYAVAAGTVTAYSQMFNSTNSVYQFNITVRISDQYENEYIFEPFASTTASADIQAAAINISVGQHLSAGDLVGTVIPFASDGSSHLHLGLRSQNVATCPESYFSASDQAALLAFFQSSTGSTENLCAVR